MEKFTEDNKNKHFDIERFLKTILVIEIICVVIVWFIAPKICPGAHVVGSSMENTYFTGDRILIFRLSRIDRGDVVVLVDPDNTEELLIKRCVAIPGDSVEIKNDHLYINDTAVEEPYIKDSNVGAPGILSERVVLKKDEYIVLGDNRLESTDSRVFGAVDKNSIVGEVK